MRALILTALIASTAACTWVPIESGGKAVRVLPAGPVAPGCVAKGEIVVSVKSKVGFYNRNPLRVQEELETLARNEAPGVGADSISPITPPTDGEQRWAMWRCGG